MRSLDKITEIWSLSWTQILFSLDEEAMIELIYDGTVNPIYVF